MLAVITPPQVGVEFYYAQLGEMVIEKCTRMRQEDLQLDQQHVNGKLQVVWAQPARGQNVSQCPYISCDYGK